MSVRCSNVESLWFQGTDDLLYQDGDWCGKYLAQFPAEDGVVWEDLRWRRPLTPEQIFGNIPWVKTLVAHKKLEVVYIIPDRYYCQLGYDGVERDYSGNPGYPSAEMTAALDSLDDYVTDKLIENGIDRLELQVHS